MIHLTLWLFSLSCPIDIIRVFVSGVMAKEWIVAFKKACLNTSHIVTFYFGLIPRGKLCTNTNP